MKEVVKSRMVWTASVVWALFWPIAFAIPREALFDLVNALAVSVGVGVIVTYSPGVWQSLRTTGLSGPHYLVIGIVCTWFATSFRQVWNWAWRFLDKPDWMIDHVVVAFGIWVLFTGGCLHLTAKGAINGIIPTRNWMALGIVVACAVMLTLIMVFILGPSRESIRDLLIDPPPLFVEPIYP